QASPPVAAAPAAPASVTTAPAKAALKSTPSPKPVPATIKPPQKPFAVLVREQWKLFYPLIERWFGVLRTHALGFWDRVREALSEDRPEVPVPSTTDAATGSAGGAPGAAPRSATAGTTIIQPSAQVRDAIKRVSEQAAALPGDADATVTIQEMSLSLNAR